MKKMKKLVSVVMSVAMVYSLTGCSSGGKESAALNRNRQKLRHPPQANLQMVRRQRRTAVIPLK